MNKRLRSTFLGGTNLLRWIMSLLLLPAATASGMAHAPDVWQIDPNNSVATLSLGSGADTLQLGLARVSGQIVSEAIEPSDPTITFSVISGEPGAEHKTLTKAACALAQ